MLLPTCSLWKVTLVGASVSVLQKPLNEGNLAPSKPAMSALW